MSNARENVNLLTSADWDIAALRLANWGSGAVPPQVMLKQNWVAGDGGGLFRYDASDTTTADNGGTVIVDAAGNRWKRQWSGPVHSRWFARGDGSTNDTAALNAWLALSSTYALTLNAAPGGKYNITAALTPVLGNDIYIAGEGEKSRIDYVGASTTPGDLLVFGNATTDYDVLTLRDFEIGSSTTLTGGYALRIKDYTNVRLNLTINGGGKCYKGVRLEGCSYVWFAETQVYTRNTAVEMNDGVEINMQDAELLPSVPGTGYGILIGGGIGGFHAHDVGALLWDIGCYVDTSLARTTVVNGTTTSGSATIASITTTGLVPGMTITGSGIPANSYVVTVGASSLTINQNASASATVSLTFFNGNTQLFFNSALFDTSVNAGLYLNDTTTRPGGKLVYLDNAWFASSTIGSGISIVNWTGGFVHGPGVKCRSNAGYGVNIADTSARIHLGIAADISYNTLGGVYSGSSMTIYSEAVPYANGGSAYSSVFTIQSRTTQTFQLTITNGANAAIPTGSGFLVIANTTNGDVGSYRMGGAGVSFDGSGASTFVAPTTTPGSGEVSVAYDGVSAYKIYNNAGGSRTFNCEFIRVRESI